MYGDRSDTATGVLRDEHQLILGVTDVLDRQLSNTDGLDFGIVDRCITFFRLYADACHHGKEEDLLFPELIEHGMPGDVGPIAVMLAEHVQGRGFVKAMKDSIVAARSGDQQADGVLRDNGWSFINLIRAHIGKEDNILFEMADNLVTGDSCRALCGRYDGTSDNSFEGQTKRDLEAIAAALTAG